MKNSRLRKNSRKPGVVQPAPDPMCDAESLHRWRARAQHPGEWAERVERLQHDLRRIDAFAPDPAACVDFEPMLDAYLDALLCGKKSSRRFAPLLGHLKTCAACRSIVEAVGNAAQPAAGSPSQDEQSGPRRPIFVLPPGRNFLARPRSQLSGLRPGVTLQIAPALVARTLNPQPSSVVYRGLAAQSEELLKTRPTIEQIPWSISAQVRRMPDAPGRLTLTAKFVSNLYPSLNVTLHWGEQHLTRRTGPGGTVCFDRLPEALVAQPDALILLDAEPIEPAAC